MATQTIPTLSTIARLLDEVDEWYARVRKVRQRLERHRPGSEPYLDLLPDLETELDALKLKVEHAHQALEEFEESLPDSH
jgi:predicted  nucleic acid-binding Zn-ribbon protein